MTVSLAINTRTAVKATIKRASIAARRQLGELADRELAALERMYRQAAEDIKTQILSARSVDGNLSIEVLDQLLVQINQRIAQLSSARNRGLNRGLEAAALAGLDPWKTVIDSPLVGIADEALRFVHRFVAADGLQLSDRLWRLDRHALEVVGEAIQNAVIQGWSADRAARDLIERGLRVPPDLAAKIGLANAERLARLAAEALLTGEGSPYDNAVRVFRTEINRAHGEAYRMSAFEHPDVVGMRFLLSPRHPRPDICDMHASCNVHGLGPGVYPRDKSPWPAHPNTFSFEEPVFADELTAEDKAGKTSRIEWLKGQPPGIQVAVLGSREKANALRAGVLREREILTAWRVLKGIYQRRGIDISAFRAVREIPTRIGGTLIFGMDPAAFRAFEDGAFADAPETIGAILARLKSPASIRIVDDGLSYFHGDGIVLTKRSMMERPGQTSRYDVYRHELGHYVDFWALSNGTRIGKVLSSTPDSLGGILSTIRSAARSLHARTPADKDRRERLRAEIQRRMDTNLADLFGALTRNKIGWGHSVEYLARPGFAETEAFANLFDLFSRRDRSAWEFVQAELPDLAERFMLLMREIGS